MLLIVAASRMVRISTFDLDQHENYAVSQAYGTLEQIVQWTPYDWGAVSFLALGVWQSLVGSDPIMLRYLSVLLFVFGSACVYAIAQRLAGRKVAPIAVLIYAAPIGLILLSLFTRGYAILVALMPFALYIALRYERRPRLITGAVLAISLALLIYVHVTGVFAVATIGLFLLVRGAYRSIRRWIAPALAFVVLVVPELFGKTDAASVRFHEFTFGLNAGQLDYIRDFLTGTPVLSLLWLLLAIAALFGLWRSRAARTAWLLLGWSVVGFITVFVLGGLIGSPRHSWWYLLPAALWIAWGVARLPRPVATGAALLALAITFAPIPRLDAVDDSAFPNAPLFEDFRWLAQKARWGDVVLVDPQSNCAPYPDEWDNAVRAFFPNGIQFVSDPAGYKRVWYITSGGHFDPDVRSQVETNRIASIFVGPSECLVRLYEGPPDAVGIPFENGLRFHGVEALHDDLLMASPFVLHKAEPLHLRLWWSVDHPLTADYSIAVHINDEQGVLIAQSDSAPQLVSLSLVDVPPDTDMMTWVPGRVYVEERTIDIPALERSATGLRELKALLIVYQWWDGVRIAAPGVDADTRLPLLPVDVRSF